MKEDTRKKRTGIKAAKTTQPTIAQGRSEEVIKATREAKREVWKKEKGAAGLPDRNLYTWAGLGLLITGSLLSLSSYFIFLVAWLTGLGISMLILSFILLTLAKTIPKIPPEVSNLLLETGIDNVATLLEELGIKSKAVYLPSSLTGGGPQALIPLHSNSSLSSITKVLPRRLITRYGDGPDNIGLLVTTTGTKAVGMLKSKPGSSTELESALISLLTGTLGVADGAKVVSDENHVRVEIHNPRIENHASMCDHCLGGPLASIVAALTVEAWNRPFIIKQEGERKGKYSIELEVVA